MANTRAMAELRAQRARRRRHTPARGVALCLLGLILATAERSTAQQPSPGLPGDETVLFQDLSRVVGASRYEQDTREAPASITIVTAEDIRRYGYRTLADVLANVRGFVVNYDRNYSYVGIRGFAVPGDYNSRILLLVDGHRLNDDVYDSGLIGTEEVVDLSLVDRVEIIRGPSSSLYGTSALFGIVNIVTRQARWVNGVKLSGEAASYGSGKGAATFGRKFGSGAELLLFGSVYHSDGQNLFFPEFDDPATNNGVAHQVDADRYARGFAKFTLADFTVQAGYSFRRKLVPTASYGTIFNDPRTHTDDSRTFAFLRYSHGFADVSRLEATFAYDDYYYNGDYPYTDGLLYDWSRGRWWTLTGQYVRPIGAQHRLVVGGEFRRNASKDQGDEIVDSATVTLDDRRSDYVWGVFAQDEFRLTRSLLLSAGLRHDEFSTFGGTTNPRVSLAYTPGRSTAVKLLYGRAFRAPNAYELYYSDGELTTKPALSLRPEYVESYEAQIEGALTPELRVTASLFHLHLTNLVTQIVDPSDGLLVFRNVSQARSTGLELESDLRLPSGFAGRISYSYQKSEDPATGTELPSSPRQLAKLKLSAPLAGERLRAGVALRYVGVQHASSGLRVSDHTTADLTLLSRLAGERVGLSATMYNLFDAAYGSPGGSEQAVLVIPQDGRNVRVGVQYQF